MPKTPAKKTGTFENSLKRLEHIVESLEQGEVSLDEALTMYEEGVKLSRECLEKLTEAEVKLKKLSKDVSGDFKLMDLNLEEDR